MTILRYVAYAFAVLLALVLVIALIGWRLPVQHRASQRITVALPRARVYDLITNVERFPAWRSKVSRVEVITRNDSALQFREIGKDGDILYSMENQEVNTRVTTRIADRKLPFGGKWLFTLRDAPGGGTELEIVEEGEVYNPIFRFVSRYIIGHDATIRQYMTDIRSAASS